MQEKSGKITGVNLGGWLVIEKWMTPELFSGLGAKDEYQLGQLAEGRARIKAHYRSFINQDDFDWLSQNCIKLVRLPVGYWLFGDQPPFLDGSKYVSAALNMAASRGISILLDLHSLPGSQNGEHHSGRVGKIGWHLHESNIIRSLDVVERLCRSYGQHPALAGIELINEPHKSIPIDILTNYYTKGAAIIRSYCPKSVQVIVSDSFRPAQMTRALARQGLSDITLDMHFYQTHSLLDKLLGFRRNLVKVDKWRRIIKKTSKTYPVIVGEWSGGLGINKRELSRRTKATITSHYIDAQMAAYKNASASYYWNYKVNTKEHVNPWNLRRLVDERIIKLDC